MLLSSQPDRRPSRRVMVGGVPIGDGSPVTVQSMTNASSHDAGAVLDQVRLLAFRGAEIVRVAVPDRAAAVALRSVVEGSPVPVVADIHFDPELAMLSLDAGVHKLRLNPGNIRDPGRIRGIAEKAAVLGVPIRIGVNSGSVPGDLRDQYGGVNEDSMWVAAQRHILLLEETGFRDIVLSLKASDPMLTVSANRKAAKECDLPLHLGVTEAGPPVTGGIRSAVALSLLLAGGIGDTVRVSLSGPPEIEPAAAWEILSSLGIRRKFPRVVSCPTCARSRIDVGGIAAVVQEHLAGRTGDMTIAVMGCEVNGPGEAREADIALIGTPAGVMLFVGGVNQGASCEEDLLTALDEALDSLV
jgi:(E)-4-hydroxy-3-methylbut-2-enyl-diphosphate synthase